jgi:hypothetical protein
VSDTEPDAVSLLGGQFSDEFLHKLECCGGWEYARTYQPQDDTRAPMPPDGDGWRRNMEAAPQGQGVALWNGGRTKVTVTYWRRRL